MTESLPFIMDEFVDTQIACQLERGSNLYQDYKWIRTPLMNYLVAETVGDGINSFYTAVSARKLMWLFTIIIFILTFFISRQITNNYVAIWAITLLASYTTFLDRSIRVRADLVSTLLSLPALWVLVSPTLSLFYIGLAGFFLGVSFLATQKAIYFVIAFGISLIGRELVRFGFTKKYIIEISKKTLISAFSFFIPIVIFFFWLYLTDQFHQFIDNGLFHAAQAGLANDTYKEATKIYFRQTLFRNPAVWYLGISGLIMFFLQGIKRHKQQQIETTSINDRASYVALSLWMMTLLILILNHKVKFPYVFLNISPSIAICAAYPLYISLSFLQKKQNKIFYYSNLLFLVLTLYYIFIPSLYRHHYNLKKSSLLKGQRAIMNRVDSITKIDDYVFDGIGMAVTRKKATPFSLTARWFNERKAGADYDIIGFLMNTEPKVIIMNYRIKRLQNEEKNFIEDHFIWDWANIFVVGKKINHTGPGETKIIVNLLASTEYAVLSKLRENILIDGNIPDPKIFLSAGEHEIIIKETSQTFILKYFPAASKPLPPQKPFVSFPSYRD